MLFHGVGDNSAVMWAPNIKELSENFFCIAVDTLGGPGKSIPNEKYEKRYFNKQLWINDIADYFHLKIFNIAGVSNGAAIVFNYTTKESNKINKAVCIEGGIVSNPLKSFVSTLGMMFPEILHDGEYKYKIVQNAGHALNHEQPEITNNEIINFLLK